MEYGSHFEAKAIDFSIILAMFYFDTHPCIFRTHMFEMSANFQPTDAGGAYVWPDEASAEGLSGQQEVLQDYRTVKYRENVNKACESYEYFECKNLQEEQDTKKRCR